jgi:hypothetical protein
MSQKVAIKIITLVDGHNDWDAALVDVDSIFSI